MFYFFIIIIKFLHINLAQQQLAQQVTDDHVTGQDETLHKNLRSVYIQTAKTDVKVQGSTNKTRS